MILEMSGTRGVATKHLRSGGQIVLTRMKLGEFISLQNLMTILELKLLIMLKKLSTALSDVNSLLLSIPLNLKRKYIDKDINRILKKRQTLAKGRTVRNPKLSKARYSLSKPCVPNALKKAFEVYDAKLQAKQRGEKVNNYEIGKRAKLVYNERAKADEVPSEANRRRTISILVSRHISNVKRMIDNAGGGIFP